MTIMEPMATFTVSVGCTILTLLLPCPFGKWNLPKGDVDGTTICCPFAGVAGRRDGEAGGVARHVAALATIRPTVRGAAGDGRTTDAFARVCFGPGLEPGTQERGGDRVLPRSGSPGLAEIYRPSPVGPSAAVDGVGSPGGRGDRRGGWRDRFRSLRLPQEGQRFGRRAEAMVRPARQDRQLSGRRLHGLCVAHRTRSGRFAFVLAERMGRQEKASQESWRAERDSFPNAARAGLG